MASFQNDAVAYCEVTDDYLMSNNKELNLVKGEIVVILNKHTANKRRWEGLKEENGKLVRGLFPSNFVVELTADEAKKRLPADATRAPVNGTIRKMFKNFCNMFSLARHSGDKSQARKTEEDIHIQIKHEHEKKMERLTRRTNEQIARAEEIKKSQDEEQARREAEDKEHQRMINQEDEEQRQFYRSCQEKQRNKEEKEREKRRRVINRSMQQDEQKEKEREKNARLEKEREQKLRKDEEDKWRQQREKEERERELIEHQQRLMRLNLDIEKNEKNRKAKLEQKIKQLKEQNLRAEQIDRERQEQMKKEMETSRIIRKKEMERQCREEDKKREREKRSHNEKLAEIDAKLAKERENMHRMESEAADSIRRLQEESFRFAQMRGQASGAAMQSVMKQNYERGMQDAMTFMKDKMENAQNTEMNGVVVMYDENESSRGIAGVVGDMFRMTGFIVPPAVPLEEELPPTPAQCRLKWLVMYIVIKEESSFRTSIEKASQYLNHSIFSNCSKLFILQILQPGRRSPQEAVKCTKAISIITTNPEYHKEVERKLKTAGERFREIALRLKSDAKQRSNCFVQG